MLTHEEMVTRMLNEPTVKAEYDSQSEEFTLLDELLRGAAARRLDSSGCRPADGYKDARCSSPGGRRRKQATLTVARDAAEVCGGGRLSSRNPIAAPWRASVGSMKNTEPVHTPPR